ncbi:MAG: phosphatidate cytidylyltransferase [Candidatus Eremiobacterota bacterium]
MPQARDNGLVLRPGTKLFRRLVTALALGGLSVFLILWGTLPFTLEVIVIALIGLGEFYSMVERKGVRPARTTGAVVTAMVFIGAYFLAEPFMARLLLFLLTGTLITFVLRLPERVSALLDGATTVMGFLYLGWMFSYLILLRRIEGTVTVGPVQLPMGAALVLLLVITVVCSDTGAYLIGKLFGRRPLSPRISPGKTQEGALGAVLCAVSGCAWLGSLLGLPLGHLVVVGALVAVTGQLGDLWESALKREVGLKDSGNVLEGHGGVLDRFDSLAFAAPAFYLYLVTFILV